jgi:ribosome recycling factor
MLTETEKKDIQKAFEENGRLSVEVKSKLIKELKEGERKIFALDTVCCKYYDSSSPAAQYESCDSSTCNYIGGTAVDSSYCTGSSITK